MLESFGDVDREKEEESWQTLAESVPDLAQEGFQEPVPVAQLFQGPIHERLAKEFLRLHHVQRSATFITDEQLFDMAAETMTPGRVRWETNIDEVPGIYIFVGLLERSVLKVGQAENLRDRFSKGHLRYGYQTTESKLIDFCMNRWEWPDCLRGQEITALMFPMRQSCEEDRCFIEFGLSKLLSPQMK